MKIVAISDTHTLHYKMVHELPEGDILIHAGDIGTRGKKHEVEDFNAWLGFIKDKYRYIIVIAGNHDFYFEENKSARNLITNAIYLENEEVVIDGIKFYGSPVSPWFHDWAFNRHRGDDIRKYWDAIPDDVNVLIVHGPSAYVNDKVNENRGGENVGCVDLAARMLELKDMKLFVCGHIHEEYGTTTEDGVTYVNASICNASYEPINKPIVIDFEL